MNSIKGLTQQLSNARQGIAEKKNISENIERMKNSFDQLGPALKGQLQVLKIMSPQAVTQKEGSEKLLEQKRYFERFLDIINNEYEEIITVCMDTFLVPSGRDKKPEQAWDKILYAKDKYFSTLKESLNPETNYFELVFRMLNVRDSLMAQLLKSFLYKKLLLWKDMAIPNESFVHAQIKNILTIIEALQNKGLIVPQKPEFKLLEWDADANGVWRFQSQNFSSDLSNSNDALPLSVIIKLVDNNVEEMLQSLRNFSNLSGDPQQLNQIQKNGKRVTSLRGEIEYLTQENQKLQQNYNDLKVNIKTTDFDIIKKLNLRIEEIEAVLARKEREINELMSNSKGSLNLITNLREKLKELEEENHKFNTQFFPKLREVEGQQLRLLDEFNKLKKDIDTYSSLFKLESQMREKALKDKEYAENQVQELVTMLGKQKSKSKEISAVVKQKDSIINKIVESRRETILNVDVLKLDISSKEFQMEQNKEKYTQLDEKLQTSEKKYQDMFEINTHFNKRIYVLEKQKKDLLDLLKQYDIQPDPTKLNNEEQD